MCVLVQGGGGLVLVGFGLLDVVVMGESVGIASNLDLTVCVFIEFVQWEVPELWGFLAQGVGCVFGCLSVAWVGGVWGGVAVCNEVFFEQELKVQDSCWDASYALGVYVGGDIVDGEGGLMVVLDFQVDLL